MVKMGGKARFAAPPNVFFLPVAAQRDAGEAVSALAELTHQVVAAAVRQAQVAQQQVEGLRPAKSRAVATSPAVSTE